MIEFAKTLATVSPDNLSKVLYSRELIAALARQLVAGQVEGHLDMMSDYPSEYKSYDVINTCVQGAKETVKDYIEDLLTEFRDNLYAEIENVRIETAVVKISCDHIDADVIITSKV